MLDSKTFKEEASTLTKWLISIPSITGTKGEEDAPKAVYEALSSFGYFRNHLGNLHYIPHTDQKLHSVIALVKIDNITRDTLVVLCNSDTSGNDAYGKLKPYAFKSDELKEQLRRNSKNFDHSDALDYSNTICGLGVFESKAITGTLLTFLKYVTERLYELPFNLLFVCTSNSICGNEGIRQCLPYLHDIIIDNGLDIRLAVSFAADENNTDSNNLTLYTSNMGKVDTCFYILGKGSHSKALYSGFSPTLIAARITEKMELNPKFASSLSEQPLVPEFKSIHCKNTRSPNSPDSVQLCFELPFVNISLSDLLELLKSYAAHAIEEIALELEDRQYHYMTSHDLPFVPESRDAEVIAYSDLFYRASRHYRGDLRAAIENLLQKCKSEEYSPNQTIRAVIEKLNELARLPKPSVIVYLGNNFVPQQQIHKAIAEDRDIYIKLNAAVEQFNKKHVMQIKFGENFTPSDSCFIRPVGMDLALKTLKKECPLPLNIFYNLGAPAVTLCIKGGNLYEPTEHISTESFELISDFLEAIYNVFKPQESFKGALVETDQSTPGDRTAKAPGKKSRESTPGTANKAPDPAKAKESSKSSKSSKSSAK